MGAAQHRRELLRRARRISGDHSSSGRRRASRMSVRRTRSADGPRRRELRRLGFQPGDALAIIMPMTPRRSPSISASSRPAAWSSASRTVSAQGDRHAAAIWRARWRSSRRTSSCAAAKRCRSTQTSSRPARRRRSCCRPETRSRLPLRRGDCAWGDFLEGDATLRSGAARAATTRSTSSSPPAPPASRRRSPGRRQRRSSAPPTRTFTRTSIPATSLVWPTNLGWMMGPWLIFASLMNRATIGTLSAARPTGRGFGRFVQDAGVDDARRRARAW